MNEILPGILTDLKIQDYLGSPEIKGLSQQTQNNYRTSLLSLKNFCRKRQITTFEDFAEHMPALVDSMRHLTGQTIQQYLTRIKIFLKKIECPVEFTYKISNADQKEHKRKHLKRWFSEDEIAKCLAYTWKKQELRYRILVRLFCETGARVRELANVKAQDIDIEDGIIWLYDSKTEPRPAFFGPITQDLIQSWKDSRTVWEGKLFPSTDRLRQVIDEMLKDLGLKNGKDGRGSHTFRHYVASYMFYVGNMRIEDVAFLMGDTVDTIRNKYLHPTPLMLRERVVKAFRWEE